METIRTTNLNNVTKDKHSNSHKTPWAEQVVSVDSADDYIYRKRQQVGKGHVVQIYTVSVSSKNGYQLKRKVTLESMR